MNTNIVLIILLATVTVVHASELDRFGKCYKQFMGEVVTPNHSLLVKVRQGQLTGTAACAELLKSGNMVSGSLNSSKLSEGKKILHTFNVLHNSFFSHLSKKHSESGSRKYERFIYDYNDKSYYLLNALFSSDSATSPKSNYPFSKIFSDPITYRAKREADSNNGYRVWRIQKTGNGTYDGSRASSLCSEGNTWTQCTGIGFKYQMIAPSILADAGINVSSGYLVGGNTKRVREDGRNLSIGQYGFNGSTSHNALFSTLNWNWGLNDLVQFGEIVGVEPRPSKDLPHLYQRLFWSSDGYYRSYLGPAYEQPYPAPIDDVFDNLSTGILFTPNFQESLGMDLEQVNAQNGVDKVPREWVQDVIKDFLCREVPVIRHADAISFTTDTINQKAPFRHVASCMRCHATIDALSTIARNYQYSQTAPLSVEAWINRFHIPTKDALSELPETHDNFFPVRPGDGHFRYRDYAGKFHNVPLTSSQSDPQASFRQFASYLSQMDDPYICMTSKYFKYLTGIEPVFFDPGELDAPALSERDKAIQTYLRTLGKDLKQNGDLRKIILDIVSSDLFVDPEASSIK